MTEKRFTLARKEQRIINVVIDMATMFVIWLFLTFILIRMGFDMPIKDETGEEVPLIPIIILVPIFWTYYIATEHVFQQSLGKLITKTKVVSVSGNKPSFLQIIFRTLSRSIPFEYFSYLVTVEGIHDRISKTRVIEI